MNGFDFRRIADPIHKTIGLSEIESEIIRTAMRRLTDEDLKSFILVSSSTRKGIRSCYFFNGRDRELLIKEAEMYK